MFVKVKELLLERRWSYAVHAAKYDDWLAEQASSRLPVQPSFTKHGSLPCVLPLVQGWPAKNVVHACDFAGAI